jgi:L-erythro-3,5-diaminohexanoate dehydrogenase
VAIPQGIKYDNAILLDVISLDIDSAFYAQIEGEAGKEIEKIKSTSMGSVVARGKQQDSVANSGGMLIGRVGAIRYAIKDRDLK